MKKVKKYKGIVIALVVFTTVAFFFMARNYIGALLRRVILGKHLPMVKFEDFPPSTIIPPGEPMERSPFEPCDLDFDGDCDETDQEIFGKSFGKCMGDPDYNSSADFDGDGCVDPDDRHYLFPNSP